MIEEIGARIGRSTCGGRLALTSVSFSATTWRARKMSVPQSNSTQTTAMPTAVAERTRRTSEAPLIAASIGNVTSVSISSGAMPRPSVEDRDRRRRQIGEDIDRHAASRPGAGAARAAPTARAPSSDGRSTIESVVSSATPNLNSQFPTPIPKNEHDHASWELGVGRWSWYQCTWPSAGSPFAADASCTSYAPRVTTRSPA